ncbi:DUF308 domain-containing protein [uncultured Methanobrevibacter sp.]|uniref:DUF308 domain-containing protein n=1 Tax=uncultured Methanobrevibacter sp. TaxID=253161 RepID=UPI0025E02435|nr:DUF308 domain-containing protein [uncultured Methanobrevibacter sp.]
MKRELMSIISIMLGIIVIIFPLLGYIQNEAIVGLSILLMSIYLLLCGVDQADYDTYISIINTILGFLLLVLSFSYLFKQNIMGSLTGVSPYLGGIFLIIIGLIQTLSNRNNKYGFYKGIGGIVSGLLYIIIVTYIANSFILGLIVGIWLIICGIINFLDNY